MLKKVSWVILFFFISACSNLPTSSSTYQSEQKVDQLNVNSEQPTLNERFNLETNGEIEVHFIDVGQGDSCVIIGPNGEVMLIDAGSNASSIATLQYLEDLNIQAIDYLVITHPDADHMGGAVSILKTFDVKLIIDSGYVHTTQTYTDYLTYVDEHNFSFVLGRSGDQYSFTGGVYFTILNPKEVLDSNNSSIVVLMEYGTTSFLFMGDAELEAEKAILTEYPDLNVDVVKIAHHGSNTSTSLEFIESISPKDAIISVGDNSYGHPSRDIVQRLEDHLITTYRTDLQGTIIVNSNGETYTISTQYNKEIEPSNVISQRVDINTASLEELQTIIHIGPERAKELIELRPFGSIDDMTRINGIGDSRLEDIKKEGKAYVN